MPSMNKKVLLKVLAFGYIAIASFVVLGQNSEVCDRDTTCESRNRWLIACGAISGAIALGMAAASFFLSSDGILGTAEIGALAFLVLWWAAGAGVAASVRTASTPVSTGFAFFALFVSFSMVRLSSSLYDVYQLACVMAANSFAPPPSRPPLFRTPLITSLSLVHSHIFVVQRGRKNIIRRESRHTSEPSDKRLVANA
jgi:hypothetical protein